MLSANSLTASLRAVARPDPCTAVLRASSEAHNLDPSLRLVQAAPIFLLKQQRRLAFVPVPSTTSEYLLNFAKLKWYTREWYTLHFSFKIQKISYKCPLRVFFLPALTFSFLSFLLPFAAGGSLGAGR